MNQRSTQRLLWGVLSVALILIAAFALLKWMRQDTRTLEDYGALPAFSMTDQNGQTVTQTNFLGHIWIADLIFTHCTSICPILTEKMVQVQHAIADQPDVKIASFSVDPKNDPPDTLAAYAKAHNANTSQWTFLVGTVPATYSIIKTGFHLPLDSVGGDQGSPILHSPRFALVDQSGHVRAYYDGVADSTKLQILDDIALLKRNAAR